MEEKDAQLLVDVFKSAADIDLTTEQAKAAAAIFKVLESAGHEGLAELNRQVKLTANVMPSPHTVMSSAAIMTTIQGDLIFSFDGKKDLALEIIKIFGKNKKRK